MPTTAAELARLAFDYALDKIIGRAKKQVSHSVTREDFEQALIELRFSDMQLTAEQIDHAREHHEQDMQALRDRLADERASGDVVDVTLVEPTGDEPTVRAFPPRPPRKDDE